MNPAIPAKPNLAEIHPTVPLRRYLVGQDWEVVPHAMDSPAPDGSVAYFFDTLSPGDPRVTHPFSDETARALCHYIKSLAVRNKIDICDGPYLQILEDDGSVPHGWVMLRAVMWVEEFDLVVPA